MGTDEKKALILKFYKRKLTFPKIKDDAENADLVIFGNAIGKALEEQYQDCILRITDTV